MVSSTFSAMSPRPYPEAAARTNFARLDDLEEQADGEKRILFAIPKKGRLFEQVNRMLEGAGLDYTRPQRVDVAQCKTLPVTLVFLPAADIPKYVAEGNVDLGITGQDMVAETVNGDLHDPASVVEVCGLGFGSCRLCVQAPADRAEKELESLKDARIVTSFPNLTKKFWREKFGKEPSVRFVSGSVEAACGLGLADAVVDLVETGTTMKAAGLEVVETMMTTGAVLIRHSGHASSVVQNILDRIDGYMAAQKYVYMAFNCEEKQLDAMAKIAPGKRAPTVNYLRDGGVAVSTMVPTKQKHRVMDELRDAGATDIIAFKVECCRA